MTIYFDNAATTFPKPPEVYEAQDAYFRKSANPGRGAHKMSLDSARQIFEARLKLAEFLGVKDASRLVFTGGCTIAVNMVLKGLGWRKGDVVITSALEHNAVMRPLRQLEESNGVRVVTLPYAGDKVVEPAQLSAALSEKNVRLCVVAHASNVTGNIVDLDEVAGICREKGVPLMVDAAQSAGICDARIEELGISFWCASGHKGLMGSPGVGLLYVSPQLKIDSLVAGGTGSASERLSMPESFPDHLESGTLPGPAIAGLGAGVEWIAGKGIASIVEHERSLARQFAEWASRCDRIVLYGPTPGAERRTGVVAFQMRGLSPDRIADLLDTEFDIAVRPGLHCAALAHTTLGTLESGLVRASFGPFNTAQEVELLCQSLELIALKSALL